MNNFDDLDLEAMEKTLESSVTNNVIQADKMPDRAQKELHQPSESESACTGECTHEETKTVEDGDENKSMTLLDWVQCIMSALVAGVLIFLFIGRAINIEGNSMLPTLHDGDEVVISNLFYTPRQGDVVVLRTKTYSNCPIVKRIIATEGQTVDIDFDNGIVYVDNVPLTEPYVAAAVSDREDFTGPVTIPENCVFVLGDNRNHSTDSRYANIGPVDTRCILGRVLFILIPAEEASGERNWSRFGSIN